MVKLAFFEATDKPLRLFPMFHVILYQPEIPPNSGNAIRLCANTGVRLHLVRPLGFALDDRQLRRAGLDYHEYASVRVHESLEACMASLPQARFFALTTKAEAAFHEVSFRAGDAFVFGPESRGLPETVLAQFPLAQRLRLPMLPHSRSLNLSNAVAVAVYEAWRQTGFAMEAGQ